MNGRSGWERETAAGSTKDHRDVERCLTDAYIDPRQPHSFPHFVFVRFLLIVHCKRDHLPTAWCRAILLVSVMGFAAFLGMCLIWRAHNADTDGGDCRGQQQQQQQLQRRHQWLFFRRRYSSAAWETTSGSGSQRRIGRMMTARDRKVAMCRRL